MVKTASKNNSENLSRTFKAAAQLPWHATYYLVASLHTDLNKRTHGINQTIFSHRPSKLSSGSAGTAPNSEIWNLALVLVHLCTHLVVAEHERVERQKPLLEPRRRDLNDFVVVQDQRLQLSKLREDSRRNAPHAVARGVEHLEILQRPYSVKPFACKLVPRCSQISYLWRQMTHEGCGQSM